MSREIFEIVQGMDLKNIETQLALQCAPLITGLKISIYIYEFHSFVIDYISQFFRDIRLFFVETVSNTSLPVVCLISLVSDTIICAILPNGHSLQMRSEMFLH